MKIPKHHRKTSSGLLALGVAALAAIPLQATAALLPTFYRLTTDEGTRQEPFPFVITYDRTLDDPSNFIQAVSRAEGFGGIPPLATAEADVNASNITNPRTIRPQTEARADIGYEFQVVGTPSGTDFLYQVPVRIQANGQADVSTGPSDVSRASASVSVAGFDWVATADSSNPLDTFAVDQIVLLTCNRSEGCPIEGVFIVAQAIAQLALDTGQSGSGGANAFADPIIEIDPNFADAALFDIEFSPGLAVIPVPAAAWLFGSALGLLVWLRRKTA